MDEMDQSIISVFDKSANSPEVHQTMRDFVSLAGVFSALGNAKTFESPLEILIFFKSHSIFLIEKL